MRKAHLATRSASYHRIAWQNEGFVPLHSTSNSTKWYIRLQKRRAAILDRFRAAPSRTCPPKAESAKATKRKVDPYTDTVLFATDLMARGIDVADIDWVVQFDVPRQSACVDRYIC